jgi:flagellar biosynthesis protein FlhG
MFDQAEELRKMSQQERRQGPRVIAVTSGKGGVGKTNLVTNLAMALTDYNKKVIIVDADLGLANVDVVLGILPKFNIHHVMQGQKSISDVVVSGPKGVKIVPAASGVKELSNLTNIQVEEIISHFNEIENDSDIIFIDTGAGISWSVLSFVLAAQEIIVITTPDPTAITDAYAMIKVIARERKDTQINIKLIVNMVSGRREAEEVADKISTVARKFLGANVTLLGYVYDDPNVSAAIKQQTPFVIAYPYSPATNCVNFLAAKLCGSDASAGKEQTEGFFKRMVDLIRNRGGGLQ